MATPTKNTHVIGCPRPGCRSKILRAGAAELVRRAAGPELPGFAEPVGTGDMPPEVSSALEGGADSSAWFWRVGDMMEFENIGFSKPLNGLKYLSCADCDLAPLGYHDPAAPEREFLVAAGRVVYHREQQQ
ncbi:hypothetical protein H4R18_002979 [Coemansia javaensis]|uniref:Mss4-like protein n=1 Tax=Coemansia javaensis TaxID=2761396 RepID=A0A9W8HAA6_9FUNG|nr:hypothetical protein H4R18_002979 [Coemansia javaensis]